MFPEDGFDCATALSRPGVSNVGPLGRARDRGAATLEQLGVVMIVTLLVAAGTLGFVTYGPQLSSKLCELATTMGLPAGSCEAASTDLVAENGDVNENYIPPVCTLRETTSQYNSEFKIAFFTFGENGGFTVAENADGTVSATVTDGGGLGLETGVGGKVGKDGVALGADVDFGAGVTFKAGSTWTFDDWSAWESMEKDLNAYLAQQVQIRHAGQGAAGLHLWLWLSDGYLDAPKPPNITTSTVELQAYADATVGLKVDVGVDSQGETKWFDPNRGIYGNGQLGGSVTKTSDSETGETSETFTFSAEGGAGLNWGIVNGGGSGEFEQAYKITRNAQKEVTSIEFMRETGSKWSGEIDIDPGIIGVGGENSGSMKIGADKENQRTVETTTLDVTDQNRDTVNAWIQANEGAPAGNPFIYPKNAFSPTDSVPGDPLAELLYQEGKSSLRIYDNVASGFSFGAEFALGLKLGASFDYEESETTINSAHFLGAPQPGGERRYIEDATCAK